MLQPDSIICNLPSSFNSIDSLVRTPARPQTPYQVLRLLPKDATPAQQDSAIQAWFEPAEIHFSSNPDTLHLPGHDVPRDLRKVDIPQYYQENYFSKDSLYHPELSGGRYGVAGDPVPYSFLNDSIVTSVLIICFLIYSVALSQISNFMIRQSKNFFYTPNTDYKISETGNEIKFQMLFVCITSILIALLYYFYSTNYIADTYIFSSEYSLLGIYTGIIFSYFLIKTLLYTVVNNIFFDNKKNLQFIGSTLFITSLEGALLFPLVLLMAYFNFSARNAIYYCIFILALAKITTFYKTYTIFFRQNSLNLQIILYFCALEMTPLFVLWSGLTVITDLLKVNF